MTAIIPTWEQWHPLIVHFPIALLLVVPLFVALSLVFRKQGTAFAISALALLFLGTIGVVFAVSTGDAAGERAEDLPGIEHVLERHEELAETTEVVFVFLTLMYAAVVAALAVAKGRLDGWPRIVLHAAFLIVYTAGCALLVKTGDEGGRLVHEYGVHASVMGTGATASNHEHHEHEESDDE